MAYSETPVADLGFSPYELVFGYPVNSPLAVVYNLWWNNDPKVCEYAERAKEVVYEQRLINQAKDKAWYDRKAREVKFKEGDLVLVMRTQPGKPLSLKYFGPHKILKQTSPEDYLVEFVGTRKLQRVLHVNLLKP